MKKASSGTPSARDAEHDGGEHIYAELLGLLSGENVLMATERHHVNEHLAQCIECQIVMAKYLVNALSYLEKHRQEGTRTQAALEKLSRLTHKTLKRDVPAYAEVSENQGEDKAKDRFPFLAAHLEMCEECREAVQDVRKWLREDTVSGKSEPPKTVSRSSEPSKTVS